MSLIRSAALAALLCISAGPAFAHNGVVHTGCPYGQVFTVASITVTGAFTRATPKGAPSAGAYFVIANTGAEADTLVGASSLAAHDITLHSMAMDGSVMQMAPVEGGLAIPPGGSVALAPMGYHLMLTGMEQPFVEGQCVQMTLHFAKAGDLAIELNIGALGSTTAPSGKPDGAPSMDHDMSGMEAMSSMEGM
ncbi:MAG: copper chaperone PCu(A)C [Devosia sp.]